MTRSSLLLAASLTLGGCDPDASEPGSTFRGEALECLDAEAEFAPYEDKFVTIMSPSRLEPHEGVGFSVDDKTNTIALDDSATTYVCRCDGGCGGSACTISLDPIVATCTGTCDGTISSDGRPCWGCGWHQSPGGSPPPTDPTAGELDPSGGGGGGKPPGADPTAGSVDPTF